MRCAAAALALIGLTLAFALSAAPASAQVKWLCKPGQQPDPCRESMATTVLRPDGGERVRNSGFARRPKLDCFYVYPTVSGQPTINANTTIDPEQVAIARYQAARFSKHCKVWAPVYRQVTLAGLGLRGSPGSSEALAEGFATALGDVRRAWRSYWRTRNRGKRPFVLIGHSQGTGMLSALLSDVIEKRPRMHRRLVSALLLGGNVTVRRGGVKGGSFRRTPACERPRQTGCVIGFSTFSEEPPDNALFGRTGGPFSDPDRRLEVLCTNPASLARNRNAPLDTYVRSEPFPGLLGAGMLIMYGGPAPSAETPWVKPADRYRGRCERANGSHVLIVDPVGESRPLRASPTAEWGLHLGDVNLPLGNLVRLVRKQGRAYSRAR